MVPMAHATAHAHHHVPAVDGKNERRVLVAFVLTAVFTLVEAVGGFVSGSLALLADAGHMATDTAALGLAWTAFRASRRPSDSRRTYGYHRLQVMAAFVNGLALIAIVAWIGYEAVVRLVSPRDVLPVPMLVIAVAGLAVNIVSLSILRRGSSDNLNVQGAALHVLGDLLGSVAAIVAAVVILTWNWTYIDPLLSILVALLVLHSAWRLVKRSAHVLLEGAPDWIDQEAMKRDMAARLPQVRSVHHVHTWLLTQERPLMTLHAEVDEDADHQKALQAIREFLRQNYGVEHATIQVESGACPDRSPGSGRS
jgi:cobalt-zinc-cadmium efflux system protein